MAAARTAGPARFTVIATLLALAALALWGCSDPSGPDDQPDDPEWKMRTSPANVLYNLVTAYEHEDVEVYLDCMSADFIFFLNPNDVEQDPGLEPGYWDKAEERTIHENMFGGDDVDRIVLTLTQVGDPTPVDPGDGTGMHWQYTESVDLRVYVGDTQYWANAPSRYEFRIDQDQVGPNGEQLWEICVWHDLSEGRGEADEEETWGSVKALFR